MVYKSIKVVKGNGGFGGPLVITSSEAKHKFIYITGGGEKPVTKRNYSFNVKRARKSP